MLGLSHVAPRRLLRSVSVFSVLQFLPRLTGRSLEAAPVTSRLLLGILASGTNLLTLEFAAGLWTLIMRSTLVWRAIAIGIVRSTSVCHAPFGMPAGTCVDFLTTTPCCRYSSDFCLTTVGGLLAFITAGLAA